MIVPNRIDKSIFYTLREGWVLMNQDIEAGTYIEIGAELPLKCMFQIRSLIINNLRVGLIFNSGFETINAGGYLLTHMQHKRAATEYDILLKDEFIVLYDYPNRGTLAISPPVNDEVLTVFEEQ